MVVAQQGNHQMSAPAVAVARAACEQGFTATEIRTDPALRARLALAAGETVLDEAQWQEVQAAVIEQMRRAVRAVSKSPSECRSCGQPIRWVETVQGKKMPLDPLVCPSLGNVELRPSGSQLLAFVHSPSDVPLVTQRQVFRSHYATCPQAKRRSSSSATVKTLVRRCRICRQPMDARMWQLGERTHPTCSEVAGG